MSPIEEMWQDFAQAVLHADIPPYQYIQLRRVFFSGAISMFTDLMEKVYDRTVSIEEGQRYVDAIEDERDQFVSDLANHRPI